MTNVQDIIKKCSPWMRISIGINIHVKKALINVLHNYINDTQVQALPADSAALYAFLQTNKSRIQNSKFIKGHQKSILLPASGQSVDSSSFDISLTRFLIQTFCGIWNARGDWREPDPTDHTICAYVYRAAALRNSISHDDNIEGMNATKFEKKWKQLEEILQGLKYVEDIEPFKTETLDFKRYKEVILEEFMDHLKNYKEECLNNGLSQDNYILRRFSVDGNINDIATESDLEILLQKENNDCVIIHAEAGMGKSSTARFLRNEWCKENILNELNLLYFESKKMNKRLTVPSHAAPLYFSELGYYLKKNGRTEDDLSIYRCVKTTIEKLIILIDGIDEFPVRNLITRNYVDELEKKVNHNEKINATETIIAIYFGFLFPNTKICLLGRNNEFERLKELIPNSTNRVIKDLELLKFNDVDIQMFTCLNICDQEESNGQRTCNNNCKDIYDRIKDIELCKTPTDLNSLIKLHKKHPDKNIGRITRTKLIIATILNRLNEHTKDKSYFKRETFGNIRIQRDKIDLLECILTLGKLSVKSLLKDNVTVQVNEIRDTNDIIYFEDENQIRIKRETFEELDLFYVRDLDYYFILEPHHTLNIEFLCACYLFSNPNEWDSILKLHYDRQLIIISFIAGLNADDYFTKDFVLNVLNTLSYSLKEFFSWLYNIEDVRESLPDGGYGYKHWFGLMENQKLSPSLFLLNLVFNEVEIPKDFIPKTIVCYCDGFYDAFSSRSTFDWYDMDFFNHNFLTNLSDKLNLELFLDKFPQYDFIIKGDIVIHNNDEFNLLNKCGNNNRITFRINNLIIDTLLNASFSCNLNVNTLDIRKYWDSRTIDIILNAISPPPTKISLSNSQTAINCKLLHIWSIQDFNSQQTEKLVELGLRGVVDSIRLWFEFFRDGKLAILKNAERKSHKMLNIELRNQFLEFSYMFGLPNLASRHVSLLGVRNVTDNDLIKLRKHIQPGCTNNLNKYRIIDPSVPFVRKEHSSQDCDQSMFLNLYEMDFNNVSDEEFAKTFSLIPSLSFLDNKRYFDDPYLIPSPHWSRLSRIVNCRINEMRIWNPQSKNFNHLLNIKTNLLQLVCESKDKLKVLLYHIVTNTNDQLNKQIKVFVVTCDKYDWNYYEEIPVFNVKTIEEYKSDCCSYDLLLDSISVPFHEGESHLKSWCCEISVSNIDTFTIVSANDDEPLAKKTRLSII